MNKPNQIWQRAGKDLLDSLQSGPQGLTTKEAQQRIGAEIVDIIENFGK